MTPEGRIPAFELTENMKMVRNVAREIAEKEIKP